MTTTALIPVLQENSLSLYLREIAKFPMLDPDREYMLARRYHDYQDLDAAHELTTSHLRLAAKVALTFRHLRRFPPHYNRFVLPGSALFAIL